MHGLDTYDYGARQYDGAKIVWDRMDQLCEKYYNINPYMYCGGNPVKHMDLEGKEKIIAIQPGIHNGINNNTLIKEANNFNDDPNMITIWAHGSQNGISVYDSERKANIEITNAVQMDNFLNKNSEIYKEKKNGENVSIVLYACQNISFCKKTI